MTSSFSNKLAARRGCRGFTLAELAIVLLVVAVLLGGLLMPLSAQIEQRNLEETRRRLDEVREALIGFAEANGRLPCPASATSDGREAFCTGASGACGPELYAPPDPNHGRCAAFYDGFVPAVTLGLAPVDSQGYLPDAWGTSARNRIRYAVAPNTVAGVDYAWTGSGPGRGPRAAGLTNLGEVSKQYLWVCSGLPNTETGGSCDPAVKLTDNAPALVYSVGKNATDPASGTTGDEAANPNPNGGTADQTFVSRTSSPAGAAGGQFDDIVTWVPLPVLLNRMVAAGQLP